MTMMWGSVRGQVVFDSTWHSPIELSASGFSMVGTRHLLITDHPAVYVHDSGGLSAASVTALEPATEPAATVALTSGSTRLLADLRLPGGRALRIATAPLPSPALSTLTQLAGRLLPGAEGATFVSPCEISVSPWYDTPATGPAPGHPAPDRPAELTAYVVVEAGRLAVRSRGQVILDWPLNRVEASPHGPTSATVRAGAMLGGHSLAGVVVHLVTAQVREAFLAAVATTDPVTTTIGLANPVTVRGLRDAGEAKADCVLSESALDLQPQQAPADRVRFDLADPRVRIAGSAQRFVVFHPESGPVAVRSDSDAFARRLYEHHRVQAAAERSLRAGPFPAELTDGAPVACAATPDAVRVKGPTTDVRIPLPALRKLAGEREAPLWRLTLATGDDEVAVCAPMELIQALHTGIVAAGHATAAPGQLPDLLRAAAGLEEDYFLCTIFGPFYELHTALLASAASDQPDRQPPAHQRPDLAAALEPPRAEAGSLRTAAVLAEGLAQLQRHLDQVAIVLPSFVRHRDAELLAPAGLGEPDWLPEQEHQLRQALAPVQRAAAQAAALAGQAARLLDLDPTALPRPSYAGAAVTLGAGALLNPVLLVAGAAQAYQQYSQGEQRKARLSAQTARSWSVVTDRWNALVGELLPVLAHVVTDNLYPHRWQAARLIAQWLRAAPAEHRPAVVRAVARRVARLDVLRRYPAGTADGPRRADIAARLRSARDATATPRFLDF